ncbi:hypothetical protein PF023_04035 [Enterococcus thailandicus]|uniref:hypothetical protein n=1 Tax=Enterococcus thailandicus TaxID=417368 RepID=UPI0022EBBC86|nr:hypothetical protein [Enterococcus thailandicus]MDA3973207.1 hypothetical protein [Enterococcus thailandicus]MDA3975359.1 hypothetical protein [Enterococcus thailandicus]MDA3980667.1 hypothetical protein [Enterococcus thailandicus]
MKMLDLLNDDNIKKAITYLLNSDLEESESYKQKQRFTKLSTEDELPKIDYISQKEHAIDWIFSKTLWHKAKNNGSMDLAKLINDIQCTPLLLYLAIVVDLITEDDAENYINEITNKLEECSNITSKNVRFKEKKALINVIGENWSKAIANKLIQ